MGAIVVSAVVGAGVALFACVVATLTGHAVTFDEFLKVVAGCMVLDVGLYLGAKIFRVLP